MFLLLTLQQQGITQCSSSCCCGARKAQCLLARVSACTNPLAALSVPPALLCPVDFIALCPPACIVPLLLLLLLWLLFCPLQVEDFELPSPSTVCMFVLVSYFFVTAGIAYDIINEPPAIGARQDPETGGQRTGRREGRGSGLLRAHSSSSRRRAIVRA
jgi:hypothetical protein